MHQDFGLDLAGFLKRHWGLPTGGLVRQEAAVGPPADAGAWTKNYRVPDIVLVAAADRHIDRRTHLVGPPTVVVEVHSPGDETYDKLAFYFDLGVPEVWVFDRDTKAVELRVRADAGYALTAPDAAGWHASPAIGLACRPTGAGTLLVRLGGAADEIPAG